MARLAKVVMVFPQSSVSIERVFSQLKNFKTDKRNRLNTENLQASLLLFQKHGEDSFEITKEMLVNYEMSSQQLKKKPSLKQSMSQIIEHNNPVKEENKTMNEPEPVAKQANFVVPVSQLQSISLQDQVLFQHLEALMKNTLTNILIKSAKNTIKIDNNESKIEYKTY